MIKHIFSLCFSPEVDCKPLFADYGRSVEDTHREAELASSRHIGGSHHSPDSGIHAIGSHSLPDSGIYTTDSHRLPDTITVSIAHTAY
jgi:hypothetical protein